MLLILNGSELQTKQNNLRIGAKLSIVNKFESICEYKSLKMEWDNLSPDLYYPGAPSFLKFLGGVSLS